MRRFMALVSMFCFAVILSISCDKVKITPAPEVEVVFFTPFGFGVLLSDTFVIIEQIDFQVQNHVDAIVKSMSYDFLSATDSSVVASGPTQGWGLQLSGEADCEGEPIITSALDIPLDVTDAIDYMYKNNENTVAVVTFSGEDAYGEEKEFSCTIRVSINRATFSQGAILVPLKQE